MASLEITVDALESEFLMVKNVNAKLSIELDNLHQYQCCACTLVDRLNLKEKENEDQITEKVKNLLTHILGINGEKLQQEFDKCHHVGPVKDGQQTSIVCFKSHKFKEEVYKKR